jgi:ATP-dependent protease HslVU (ClpYQ) peptidase subunit
LTVVAWDGTAIAADRQATQGGTASTLTKLQRLDNGEVLTWTGNLQNCFGAQHWYCAGAKPSEWVNYRLNDDEHSELIVLSEDGLYTYNCGPFPQKIEDKFAAFGSGKELALGALAMGATAKEAVEIASRFDTGCGLGVDVMHYEKPKRQPPKKATKPRARKGKQQ